MKLNLYALATSNCGGYRFVTCLGYISLQTVLFAILLAIATTQNAPST